MLKFFRLLRERFGGGGGFFDQRGILLRGFVHLGDCLGHLLDPGFLFLRGIADVGDNAVDRVDGRDDPVDRGAGFFCLTGAALHFFDGVRNQSGNFLGGLGRALRQGADFGGYHRKAFALFAGTGRFDGGIEREDVGLEGDAVDDPNDVADLARTRLDLEHGFRIGLDHAAPLVGNGRRVAGQHAGMLGAVRILLNHAGELLHAGGGFFQAGGLFFRTGRQVAVAGRDFLGGGIDGIDRLDDIADQVTQFADGRVEGVRGLTEEAGVALFDRFGQIAVGQGLADPGNIAQGFIGGIAQAVEQFAQGPGVALFVRRADVGAEVTAGGSVDKAAHFLDHRAQGLNRHIDGTGGLAKGAGIHRLNLLGKVALRQRTGNTGNILQARVGGADQLIEGIADVASETLLARHVDSPRQVTVFGGKGHLMNVADQRLQPGLHVGHGGEQLTDFVLRLRGDAAVQLSKRNRFRRADCLLQGLNDAACDGHADEGDEGQHGGGRDDHQGGHGLGQRIRVFAGAVGQAGVQFDHLAQGLFCCVVMRAHLFVFRIKTRKQCFLLLFDAGRITLQTGQFADDLVQFLIVGFPDRPFLLETLPQDGLFVRLREGLVDFPALLSPLPGNFSFDEPVGKLGLGFVIVFPDRGLDGPHTNGGLGFVQGLQPLHGGEADSGHFIRGLALLAQCKKTDAAHDEEGESGAGNEPGQLLLDGQ